METLSFTELKDAGQRAFQAGNYTEAAKHLRAATETVPTSAETWRALGFALKETANHPDAVAAFRTAIGLDPQNADGFYGLGLLHADSGDQPRAITAFDEALQLAPNHLMAKQALVKALLMNGRMQLATNDHYGGDQSLERAYKLQRDSAETVLPYVEHLIESNQHKKAFDVIEAAVKDAPNDAKVKALKEKMDADPRLSHAKHLHGLATTAKPAAAAQPQRPSVNPDEVPCPCGATRVMKWATVCPTCNNRIGDPSMRASAFAGHENISATTWVDVAYIVMSVLWLLYGGFYIYIGLSGQALFGQFDTGRGIVNAGVALGLLFQVEWVQFLAKILMILNLIGGGWMLMSGFILGWWINVLIGGLTCAVAGFSIWLISQLSD